MTQYGFYFDSDKCAGCKTCQVACKETYGLPVQNLYRRVYNYCGGSWEPNPETGYYTNNGVYGYYVSIACNHCANPACLDGCPVGAIVKDEETGLVSINKDVCIGCGTCQVVCPYSAPTFIDIDGVMAKCDGCINEVKAGKKPICVRACPMRALDFGPIDELKATYGEGDVEIAPLPLNSTNPSLVMNPHRNAVKTGDATGSEVSLAEELDL